MDGLKHSLVALFALAILAMAACGPDPGTAATASITILRRTRVPLIATGAPAARSALLIGHTARTTRAYDGYYVGGGAVHHGDGPRFPTDGTWGWDYFGRHFDRRVDLGWWHGRRYQAGGGKYTTDGPKLFHHE